MLGKTEGRRIRGQQRCCCPSKMLIPSKMIGWYYRFNRHEFEQTLGDSGGQGSLACCSSWGGKESDMTE